MKTSKNYFIFTALHVRALTCVLPAALLFGCALQEPKTVPQLAVPTAWVEPQSAQAKDVEARWWQTFGSTQLVAMMDLAFEGNPDLRIAFERVRQAEFALGVSSSPLLPSVAAGLNTSDSRTDAPGTPVSTRRGTGASLSVSYEVDLWGRLNAGVEGSRALLAGSRYDLETARLSLSATLATTYFQMLAAQARAAIAQDNLTTSERVLRVVQARYRNGVATSLDVSQQTATVLSQRTALLPLQVQARQLSTAIALLQGRMPEEASLSNEPLQSLLVPQVAAGVPSSLLTRRPDLASAEAQLAAADANVLDLRAALLPTLSLSGSAGLGSSSLLAFGGATNTLSIAAALSQNIFDNGRQRFQVDSARSQRVALVETYGKTVRTAFKEVEDGLGNADRNARQEETQTELVKQAQLTLRLAEIRYREGTVDLLTVLDAQRTLFTAQDQLAQIRLARLTSAVDLYRALGGGWELPTTPR